jgi:hypothetical protein
MGAAFPSGNRSRSGRLARIGLLLVLALPALAGGTQVQVGASLGGLRERPRRAFLNLELQHTLGSGPLGGWVALEGLVGDGEYLGLGPMVTWSPSPGWSIAAGSGPGYYLREDGLDLGYPMEFRSTFYLARRIGTASWLGASISHYSNGGLRKHNPGAETVRLFWAVQLP